MNQEIQTQIASILGALKQAAIHYGPQALELAYQIKRVDSIGELVKSILSLIALVIIVYLVLKRLKQNDFDSDEVMSALMLGSFLVVPLLFLSSHVFDIWNWVGAFHPEVALAHDILLKVISQ